jgi:hypothetical protein
MKALHQTLRLIVVLFAWCGVLCVFPHAHGLAASAQPAGDLTGIYVFPGLDKFAPGQFPNPLIDFSEISPGAEIRVIQQAATLEVRYRSRAGKAVTRSIAIRALPTGSRWEKGALITEQRVPVGDGFILPGAARHYRGSRVFKDAQGDLHVAGSFTERGLMLFVIPFTDHDEFELVLKKRAP